MRQEIIDVIRDFPKFASTFMTIRHKSGMPTLFTLNKAQRYLHERLEAQLKATGKVRAIVLKGRQQGCSTYIQARFFHRIITTRGKKAFILTHEAEATKNLFSMTRRYYENLPDGLCPEPDKSSTKELNFSQFDSGYAIGTAGNRGVGRSQTIQLMHGSEVAFWPHADEHAKGILQSVSNEAGTEIILESTADGIGNYYHERWVSASRGESEYQAIFLVWYWQDEYKDYTEGFRMTDEEQDLFNMYNKDGLTVEHLSWRRKKIYEFSSDFESGNLRFKQEYPFTPEEAFLNPIDEPFIHSRHVMRAQNTEVDSDANLLIGVDPARGDTDRTAIIRRRGRKAYKLETFRNHNTMEVAGLLKRIIDQEKPVKVYIDVIGIGAGVVDRLREMGYDIVEGIAVSRSANEKNKFVNLRAELWHDMKEWFMQDMPVQVPNEEELLRDLTSLGFKYDSNGRLKIESKDDLKARGMPSCDTADALMLTFSLGHYAQSATTVSRIMPPPQKGMFY